MPDLRFGTDPAADSGREVQSVQDAHGRIVGWFSWTPDRALIRAMDWLWGIAGAVGVALMFFAMMTARATLRLAGAFARSVKAVRKLTSEDILTGLPNQRVVRAKPRARAASSGAGARAAMSPSRWSTPTASARSTTRWGVRAATR